MSHNKEKEILDMLNLLQEHLLSLPEDMLLNIDPTDNESLEQGYHFIKTYNDLLQNFTASSTELEKHLKKYFEINPEEDEIEAETTNRKQRDRIIKELDKSQPHTLEEDFTYKRPYGFILREAAYKGLKTWKSTYLHLLDTLNRIDEDKFKKLPDNDIFISNRGNPLFAKDKSKLRVAENHTAGFFVEVNLSANHIRKNVKELLTHFAIESSELKIYLREDRDAESKLVNPDLKI